MSKSSGTQTPMENAITIAALDGDKDAQTDLVEKFRGQVSYTTLMIQSLPWTFTEEDLMREINRVTSPWSFDFFYMPWNAKRDSNCGYAFVNFVAPVYALECATRLIGHNFDSKSKTIKSCVVVPAHVQGLMNNVEHYRDRVVCSRNNPHCPFIFKNGRKLSFPEAIDLMCPRKGTPSAPGVWSAKEASRASPASPPMAKERLSEEERSFLEHIVSKHPEWVTQEYREMASASSSTFNGSSRSSSSSNDYRVSHPVRSQAEPVQMRKNLAPIYAPCENASNRAAGYPMPAPGLSPVPLCRDSLNAHQANFHDRGFQNLNAVETGSQTSYSSFQGSQTSYSSFQSCEGSAFSDHMRSEKHEDISNGEHSPTNSGSRTSFCSTSNSSGSSEEVAPLTSLDIDILNRFIEKFN